MAELYEAFNLGPYAAFIIACYSISLVTLAALTFWVHHQESRYKKLLKQYEDVKRESST